MDLIQIGKYTVIGKLGEGAMGVVLKAHDPVLNRHVAVKMISATGDADDEVRKRFQREARSAGQLNHPNIVTVYEFGEEQGKFYLVMELLEGTDLKDLIGARKLGTLTQRLRLMEQISAGLAFAHSKDVVHRDLKPSNIHVLPDGQAKLMDFGLARMSSGDITKGNMVMGTPHYMSPEQVRGQRADARSDVFSLGAVFYEVLSYSRPFTAETLHGVLFKVSQGERKALTEIAPDVPKPVADLVDKALSIDPTARFQDAGQLRLALRSARRDLGVMGDETIAPYTPFDVGQTIVAEVGQLAPRTPAPRVAESSQRESRVLGWPLYAAGGVILAAVVTAAILVRPSPPPPPVPTSTAPPVVEETPPPREEVPEVKPPETVPVALPRSSDAGAVERLRREAEQKEAELRAAQARADMERQAQRWAQLRDEARAAPAGREPAFQAALTAEMRARELADRGDWTGATEAYGEAVLKLGEAREQAVRTEQAAAARAAREREAEREAARTTTSAVPPPPPVNEEALIRKVLATYQRAIETKDVALYKSVRPNLSRDAEARLQASFRAISSQEMSLTVEAVAIEGQRARVRFTTRAVVNGVAQRPREQIMMLTKEAGGWVISEIQ